MEFKVGQTIKIRPLTKRMKDRVNSHGNEFQINRVDKTTINGIQYNALISSLDKTFKLDSNNWTEWSGWVNIGKDFEVLDV